MRLRTPGPIAPVAAAFFCSGAAALVYQVAWQRILSFQTGVGVHSIALIVAAFMAGLGIGSEAGGRWSARVGARRALRAFALLEIAIGLFGLASTTVYYRWLYVGLGGWGGPFRGVLDFLSLVAPTTLMGTSLPLLVRAAVRDGPGAARTIGVLYGINLLGAAAGAALTPWVLIRALGIPGALAAAAAANLAAGAIALAVRPSADDDGHAPGEAGPRRDGGPLAAWVVLYALSGFCALGLEIVWFRLVDVTVKATAFTFGSVLAVYLAGMAAGTFAGIATASRVRRPLAAFIACQCAIVGYAAASILIVAHLPAGHPVLEWVAELARTPRSYEPGARWEVADIVRLYTLVPAVAYGIPTALMGYSFVVLQRAVQDDARSSGRKVGLLQAANIAGCVAGSLAVGLGTLTWAGSAGTVRLLAAVAAILALAGARLAGPRFAVAGALLFALAALGPDNARLWPRRHGCTETRHFHEHATGVVAVAPDDAGGWRMFVNGRSHSTLPFGGLHTTLGAAPSIVHPDPRRVAIVGLGSGDTAWAAGCRRETALVRVYEVCAPELRLLHRLAARGDISKLGVFLGDPRVEVHVADGRHALERGGESYDVIEMDALPPSSPYSGTLYSLEFFRICARRLRLGGVMCAWAPTARAAATFAKAFPHVLEIAEGRVLVGSDSPLAADHAAWRARLDRGDVRRYLGISRAERIWDHMSRARLRVPAPAEEAVNTDLFPRDEFNAPGTPPPPATRTTAGR